MKNRKDINIPIVAPFMEPCEKDLPITRGENLMRAFRHEKPLWMPSLYDSTQWLMPPAYNDVPMWSDPETGISKDWFGASWEYSEVQKGSTPLGDFMEDIYEWEEKIEWPDLDKVAWDQTAPGFKRDPDKALSARLGAGNFERLHSLEGFEQALCDMVGEPEECKRFFDRVGEYKIECARHLQETWHYDYLTHNDDWSHAKAQFFSLETFEETLLDSAVAIADAVHAMGCRYMVHCCGKMDVFVPYIVNDIHADVIEIQNMCDIKSMLDQYSAELTPVFGLDQLFMYDPDTTAEQAREYARYIVDNYGAQTCEGSGVIVRMHGMFPESYYAFQDELFHYSMEKYRGLS